MKHHTTYAVMRKGKKTALRVMEDKDEIEGWCIKKGMAKSEIVPNKDYDDQITKVILNKDISIIERKKMDAVCGD